MKDVCLVTLNTTHTDLGLIASEDDEVVQDEVLHERLQHEGKQPLVDFSTGEGSATIGLYDLHWRISHCSMKTIINMANGAMTGLVLKNVPKDPPKFGSCPACALAKA